MFDNHYMNRNNKKYFEYKKYLSLRSILSLWSSLLSNLGLDSFEPCWCNCCNWNFELLLLAKYFQNFQCYIFKKFWNCTNLNSINEIAVLEFKCNFLKLLVLLCHGIDEDNHHLCRCQDMITNERICVSTDYGHPIKA